MLSINDFESDNKCDILGCQLLMVNEKISIADSYRCYLLSFLFLNSQLKLKIGENDTFFSIQFNGSIELDVDSHVRTLGLD